MPLFSSQLQLTTAASASGTPLADVAVIKGAFKVFDTYNDMTGTSVSLISNNQIVWCEEVSTVYQATITPADYISSFSDTLTWSEFTGFAGNGAGSGDITAVLTNATSGLQGGVTTGLANLSVKAGSGILVNSNGVNVNTGSLHFQSGVEYVISSGSYMIDLGNI